MIAICSCSDDIPRLDRPGGDPHCMHCGELVPLETDEVGDLAITLATARREFPGRPLVIHQGSFGDVHNLPSHGICWCLPEVVLP